MTQLEAARKGIITREMKQVAAYRRTGSRVYPAGIAQGHDRYSGQYQSYKSDSFRDWKRTLNEG